MSKLSTSIAVVLTLSLCMIAQNQAFAARKSSERSSSAPVLSGSTYGTAGCGLGSMLFGNQPGFIQVVAATFNGTAGNQTFAISSGTSNCKDTGGGNTAAVFIKANKEALEKEVARGAGETIETLAQIYGCSDAGSLGTALQKNYNGLFPNASVNADQVTQSIESTIQSDQGLSEQCVQAG